jgi:prevent-host-death family protein
MTNIVNIHEAKTHLSRLVDQAAKGQEFIIAKAGTPMVRVVAIHPVDGRRRLGGLAGKYVVPDDIKAAFADDIAALFHGKP